MKDLDQNPVKIENHEVENKADEFTFIGSLIKPFKNAILWEFDTKKMELKECEMSSSVAMGYDGNIVKEKILYRGKASLYVWSVNRKNAQRKVNKALGIS